MTNSVQRRWRSDCPNCGAPVEFASAASASAVCGFCRSTLLRDGDALRRIGSSAELFDDHSPLQIGASGRAMGAAFQVVGRAQLGDADRRWTEWHVVFDGEGGTRSGWLSEDNGAYVLAFEAELTGAVPDPEALHPGEQLLAGGAIWSVASVVRAQVLAAEGELPAPPKLDGAEFWIVDLRNAAGEVATLDWREPAAVGWSIGRGVRLGELQLQGLRGSSDAALAGRSLGCPSCGASLQARLAATQSIVCDQCHAVVDLSAGAGGDLAHYAQSQTGSEPQIPLGANGTLQLGARLAPQTWQVVGYAEHREVDTEAGEDPSAWREYLLYHRNEGFAFLVDADDGWTSARPLTGVPTIRDDRVEWDGEVYSLTFRYSSTVTYVLGEFYWRLARGERTRHTDFSAGRKRLYREQVGGEARRAKGKGKGKDVAGEVTWSAGETLDADAIARAFGIDDARALRRDVTPLSADAAGIARRVAILSVVGVVVLGMMLTSGSCSGNDCDTTRATFGESSNEYRQCLAERSRGGLTGFRGGSFGGFSTGGGHK